MKDTNGLEIKRMDFVENENAYPFLVTQQDDGLYLWDFRAWCQGYYDSYISLKEMETASLKVVGNFWNKRELLPPICDGYNGEPNCVHLRTIWVNPKFQIKRRKA